MLELGGMYYDQRRFDLALKYYEMAAECGSVSAEVGLGYIWYYGRTGETDYEKAFYYYDKASKEGDITEALYLYDVARDFLAQRIRWNPFFGNLNIMKWMIWDIYKLRPFDLEDIGFYDLYYMLQAPALVRFKYDNLEIETETHEVEAVAEEGNIVIRFDDKWFHSVVEFFQKAELDETPITTLYEELYDFTALRIR